MPLTGGELASRTVQERVRNSLLTPCRDVYSALIRVHQNKQVSHLEHLPVGHGGDVPERSCPLWPPASGAIIDEAMLRLRARSKGWGVCCALSESHGYWHGVGRRSTEGDVLIVVHETSERVVQMVS